MHPKLEIHCFGSIHLCRACKDVFHMYFMGATITRKSHHTSEASLIQAAAEHCSICYIVWSNIKKGYQKNDKVNLGHGIKTTCSIYEDEREGSLSKVEVYPDPSTQSSRDLLSRCSVIKFRLIPTSAENNVSRVDTLDMDISTSSVASLDLALDWYKCCFNSHSRCQIPLNEDTDWRPTRLVDIGLNRGDIWHLRTCSSLPPGPVKYVTLSYRWGSTSSLRLLQGNIDMLHQGLPISQLPKTFQDAVSIAQHFSIQYLWIDALCIIQDCSIDWSNEAPTMRYVYSHSTCNIAATAATDQDSGLFRQRNKEKHLPRTITAPPGALKHLGESFVLFDKEYWNRQLAQGPLYKRGWVFQECLLAPRVLYFTGNQIMWECFQETKCERFLRGIPYHEGLKNLTILWDSLDGRKECKQDAGAGNMTLRIQNLWNHLLESYSSCALTRGEDRLPALAGVARLFADTTGDEYLCGLWRSKLIEQLLWRVPRPTLRAPTQLGVPSWSWALTVGQVLSVDLCSDRQDLITITHVVRHEDLSIWDIPSYSSISIWLTGSLSILREQSSDDDSYNSLGSRPLEAKLHLDFADTNLVAGNQEMCLLPVLSLHPWIPPILSSTRLIGLILTKLVGYGSSSFQRVGQFSTDSSEDIGRLGFDISSTGLAVPRKASNLSELWLV